MVSEKNKSEDVTKFEAIVELLFGDQIKKYDAKIAKMDKQIYELEKQIRDNKKDYNNKLQLLSAEIAGNISDLDNNITGKLGNSDVSFNKKIEKLEEEKADKKILAENFKKFIESVMK